MTPACVEFHGSDEEALAFTVRTHNRRNLSKEAHDLLLGRRYNRTKKAARFEGGNDAASKTVDQNDPPLSTAAKLAVEHGVSEATVKRAGQFAEAVEAQGLEAEAMSGKLKGKKKEVVEAHRKATGKVKVGKISIHEAYEAMRTS